MRMTTGFVFAALALLAVDACRADDVVNERVPKQGLDAGIYAGVSPDVVRASAEERRENPRAAPAKLRWARRA